MLSEDLCKTKNENSTLQDKLLKLQGQLIELQSQIESLNSQVINIESYKLAIQEMTVQIDKLNEEKALLEKQNKYGASIKNCYSKYKGETDDGEYADVRSEDTESIRKMHKQNKELRDQNSKLQAAIIEKSTTIDKLKKQKEEATNELLQSTIQICDLKKKLQDSEKCDTKRVNTDINGEDSIDKIRNEMQKQIEKEKDKTRDLQLKYENTISQGKAQYLEQINSLTTECCKLKQTIDDLREQSKQYKEVANKGSLNNKNQAIISQQYAANLEVEKIALHQKIGALQKEMDKAKQCAYQTEQKLILKEKELIDYKEKATQGRDELAKAFKELGNYAQILEKLENKVTNLQKERDLAVSIKDSYEKLMRRKA